MQMTPLIFGGEYLRFKCFLWMPLTVSRLTPVNAATSLMVAILGKSSTEEVDWLQSQILRNTFTPNITLDTLKSISQLSAKALRTVMMLADIKASKHKEQHDELLDRTASLVTAIIGNVLDVSLRSECDNLVVAHQFSEPFGENTTDDINNILRCVEGEILSTESALEMNPLVKDITIEKERLAQEKEHRREAQMNIFGDTGDTGPQTVADAETDRDQGNVPLKGKTAEKTPQNAK